MFDWVIEIFASTAVQCIFSAVLSVIGTSIAFWFSFQRKLYNIQKQLDGQNERLYDVENKYQKGYNPEHLCESCYEGRYKYITRTGQCGEKWVCENCGLEPAPSWHNQRKTHLKPPR